MKIINLILLLFTIISLTLAQNQDWVYRNPLPQNDFYAIKFFDENTGYVCGSNGAILKNVTGSNQWINLSINTPRNLYSMYFFDVNHGFIAGDSGIVVQTSNGGINWIRVPTGLSYALRSITFPNSNTGFAAGDNGVIIKSTNGGTNWTVINNNSRNLKNIFFLDVNTGFAVGDSGVFMKTTNSGGSWGTQILSAMNLTSVWFTNSQTGYLSAVSQSSSNPFKTTDGGLTWNEIQIYFYNSRWYSIKFLNENTGFMVGKNCPIAKTENAGAFWGPTNSYSITTSLWLNDISIVDTGLVYICGASGCILKAAGNNTALNIGGTKVPLSSISFINENTGGAVGENQYLNTLNGGLNWSIQMVGFTGGEGQHTTFKSITFFTAASAYRIYSNFQPTMGTWDEMEHSTDGGITWSPSFSTQFPPSAISSICEVQGIAYMTALGKIYKNTGSGWNIVSSPGVYVPALSFANQNTGIALFNYPYNGFVKTTDAGSSWSLVQHTNTKDMADIQLFPSGTGYIAGDSSLFEGTTDFGNTWSQIPNNLNSYILKIQFVNENTGWLIGRHLGYSYTNKLYLTNNSGANLVQIQSLDSFDVKGMSFINALTGYVCGDSGVVLKTTNGGLTFIDPVSTSTPDKFLLHQNYPNPFNPVTKIKFDVPTSNLTLSGAKGLIVRLAIYDILGKEVAVLVNKQLSPGTYEVGWDGSNNPSGVYFYQLSINNVQLATKKMVMVK